jgi:hypothetical protein
MPFFGSKAFPGKLLGQGLQLLLGQTIQRAYVCGAMDAGVDALAPRLGLAIEIIQIREGDPSP